MKWSGRRESSNLEDRRGGGGGGVRGGAKLGGGLAIVVVIIGAIMGVDVQGLVGGGSAGTPSTGPAQPRADDEQARFVSVILADTETTWATLFKQAGRTYKEPKLVLFEESVSSACGMASKAIGPFYCPADHKAYLDLSFFRDLDQRFKAPGDFARAYVVAHEIGHHIQSLLGTSGEVHRKQQALPKPKANALSVRLELQADCYAGVWAHFAHRERKMLEAGDLEEGLRAAAAIGDDRLQKMSKGHVSPESWTHGSSAQRVKWFRVGFKRGDMKACDTFSVAQP
jgi:uncharacterized protein